MMKKNEDFKYTSIKDNPAVLGTLEGPVADITNGTRNGRKYSEELWEKAFNNEIVKEQFANGGLLGELNHPVDREETDLEKVAICMPSPPVKKEGKLWAKLHILDTPCGRILKTLCDYGYKIGISSRGTGDVYEDVDGESVDPDTYQLNAFDAVIVPAVKEARLEMVTESLNTQKSLRQALTESLEKATEDDKKIMEETLESLNLNLSEEKKYSFDEKKFPIKYISNEEYVELLNSGEGKGGFFNKFEPKGLFILKEGDVFVAIDNSTGDCWVEEFDTEEEAKEYLEGRDGLMEALIEVPEEDLKKFEDRLDSMGFNIEDIGRTWSGRKHYQVKSKEGNNDDHSFEVFLRRLDYLSDKMDESGIPMTYSCGLGQEGYVTAGIDLMKKHIDEALDDQDQIDRSDIDKEEAKEVVDDKSKDEAIVAELKESLLNSQKLEKDNLSLQEELSVCHAKEKKLEDDLANYKLAVVNLSESAKKVKPLQTKLDKVMAESLEKDDVIKSNTQALSLKEKSISSLKTKLEESKKSNEELEKKVDSLNEELQTNKQKLSSSQKVALKYKQELTEAKSQLISSKAIAYGISEKELSKKLGESYKLKEIDSICEELRTYQSQVNKLPFRISNKTKVVAKPADNEYIMGNSDKLVDDDTSSLLRMID